ncbi:chemotaxis-specific protein-glutamate methyltransferase CheB [Acerihabitans sp. TG2]|uniref:chemotaxis-specific protein-glutamate methyltransferase CheB n=1 Tax=Acerihabitans sp. TG2 TaxID=3096008 RepID=UPI002B2255F7|nr:chemotaxis-specific protein-glutamate methyltransferase CheB [Acerihabitans sp. TG2]MEA9393222.1 chemotaxis-specific protein-glutamate methyltransferase CheB [Acerihabitans sp. TG2]
MIKLLIVDDSALMRRQLSTRFNAEGDFTIRLARNGKEAVEENHAFQPDVITLDINMPEMDGLTALSMIMVERPVPVVMVSSLTEKGALATFEALNLGAVDYIVKPGGTISLSIDRVLDAIVSKVRVAAKARIKPPLRARAARPGFVPRVVASENAPASRTSHLGNGLVIIGVSTGGPRTLEAILPLLPADFPWPILVAQHMPASFTLPFAQRMDGLCALNVVEASRPMMLEPGTVYIGKGGGDMVVSERLGKLTVLPKPENAAYLWHPSAELLGRSVLEHVDPTLVVAVMLTGMGYDGADAFAELKKRGGRTIAESEDSAVVFGMPAELIARGGASVVLHCEKIAQQINAWVS